MIDLAGARLLLATLAGWLTGQQQDVIAYRPNPGAGRHLPFDVMARASLEDYVLQRYRTMTTARARVEHLRTFFDGWAAEAMTRNQVRNYQLYRRSQGAEAATVNRETSALGRMFQLAIRREQWKRMPLFPKRPEENPPRDGFFERSEYLNV